MKVTTGVIIFTFSVIPARAQYQYPSTSCPPWFTFGCYQVQQAPPRPEPRHRRVRQETEPRRQEHVRHSKWNGNDYKPAVAQTVTSRPHTKHHAVVTGQSDTWRGKSQNDARDWITEQAKSFCNKYPNDKACHRAEPEQKKEE